MIKTLVFRNYKKPDMVCGCTGRFSEVITVEKPYKRNLSDEKNLKKLNNRNIRPYSM